MSARGGSVPRWADAPSTSKSASDDRVLTSGYYQLTLTATILAGAEVRVHASGSLPSVSLLEIVVVPAFLCLLAEILYRPRLREHARVLYGRNRLVVWYGGYAAVASIVGLVRTSDTLQSFHDLFVALGLYALVALTVDNLTRLRGLLAAALAGAMINVGLSLLQIGLGGPYLVPLSKNIDAKLDLAGEAAAKLPTGLFSHPNGLAMFLLPVVLFLLVAAGTSFGTSVRRGPRMVALLAPALVVLDMTYAKGVYAWLAVGACFLVLPRKLDRHRAWMALAVVIGGITALTWYSLDAFVEGDLVFGTIVSRIDLWLATLAVLRADAFVAVFGGGGAQLAGQTLGTFEYGNAHNAWLDQALTYGVPALVFYFGGFVSAFRSLARRIRFEPRAVRSIALATFVSLVAILGESFFEPANHGIALQAQLFTLLAIAAVVPASQRPHPANESR
jgi:hypothetical protein